MLMKIVERMLFKLAFATGAWYSINIAAAAVAN